MATILQTTIWISFCSVEKFEFWFEILLKFVGRSPIDNINGLNNGLAPNRRQTIIWTDDG